MGILKNRISLAIIGLIVFGGIGAFIAAMPVRPHGTSAAQVSQTATPTATDTPTAIPQPTQEPLATATVAAPTALPTATARVTATATATPSQITDLHGTISNIQNEDNVGFTLKPTTGNSTFVTINGSTHYQGVSDFNALRSGMTAEVKGTYGTNGTFLASLITVGG